MKSFHMYTIAGLCIYIYAVYIMIQCTEPATPAVIACCELPVSIQEAVLGLKMLSPKTVLSERGRGLLSVVVGGVVPTLWKRADQKKKDRHKQYSGRCRQMQADANGQAVYLVDVTHSMDNNISPPKFIWSAQPQCWPQPID